MNLRIALLLNAVVNVVFGVALLVLPAVTLEWFGMTDHYVSTELLARFYGAALCGIGLLFWFIKDVNDQSILKNIGYVALACGVVGFVVTMIGVAGTPVIREKAWLPITLHIVFALIYGYLVFLAPKNSSN